MLWVAGERSPYIQPEHAATMRALFPKVRSVTVKGAGHWVHSEKPEAFVTILQAFLRGLECRWHDRRCDRPTAHAADSTT